MWALLKLVFFLWIIKFRYHIKILNVSICLFLFLYITGGIIMAEWQSRTSLQCFSFFGFFRIIDSDIFQSWQVGYAQASKLFQITHAQTRTESVIIMLLCCDKCFGGSVVWFGEKLYKQSLNVYCWLSAMQWNIDVAFI
jgi:type III secretory pathway component EscS